MKKSKDGIRGSSTSNFHAERWTLIVPSVVREFFNKGERFYETSNGKIYLADVYDRKLVAPKLKTLPVAGKFNKTVREKK